MLFSSSREAVGLLYKSAVVQPVLQQAAVSHGRQCVRTMRPPASEEVHERVPRCVRSPPATTIARQTDEPTINEERGGGGEANQTRERGGDSRPEKGLQRQLPPTTGHPLTALESLAIVGVAIGQRWQRTGAAKVDRRTCTLRICRSREHQGMGENVNC